MQITLKPRYSKTMKRGDVALMLFKLAVILVIAGAIVFTGVEVLYHALYQGVSGSPPHSQSWDR